MVLPGQLGGRVGSRQTKIDSEMSLFLLHKNKKKLSYNKSQTMIVEPEQMGGRKSLLKKLSVLPHYFSG